MTAKNREPQIFVVRASDQLRRDNAIRALDHWIAHGDTQVTFEHYVPGYSDAQRALFWSWCEIVARFLRDSGMPCCKESVHDQFLCDTFGSEDLGFGRCRPRRTLTRPTRMRKLEAMEVLTRFEVWASTEYGLMLPRPESWEADLAEVRKQRAQEIAAEAA